MFSDLKNNWVVAWRNIITEDYVGDSHGYTQEDTAIGTTNGAGPTNTQIIMLSPDGVVLHALPGFWHAEDLAREMKLAKELWAVWKDTSLSREQKDKKFASMQIEAWKNHPQATTLRSRWQGFDARNEHKRVALGIERDTVKGAPVQSRLTEAERAEVESKMARLNTVDKDAPKVQLKPINQLVHERMSVRPFVKYEAFDVAEFADYGRRYYDNNKKVDGEGSTLLTPTKLEKIERKQARREAMQEARDSRRKKSEN
ncbi:MAG: hypothetical protein IPK87_06870 [Planctomycetes bacterium]|nr:hypothetical protein [Planctomycetota bacterium]